MNKPNKDKKTNILIWCLLGCLGLTGLSYIFYTQFKTALALKERRLNESLKLSSAQLIKQNSKIQQNNLPDAKVSSVSELYQSVETNARDSQMTIHHFAVSQPASGMKEVMIDLVLDGDYRGFTWFLINLQRETGSYELLTCRMSPSKIQSSTVDINLKLRFKLDGGI